MRRGNPLYFSDPASRIRKYAVSPSNHNVYTFYIAKKDPAGSNSLSSLILRRKWLIMPSKLQSDACPGGPAQIADHQLIPDFLALRIHPSSLEWFECIAGCQGN